MDILGFFDGLFSFFSATRAAREISDDDAPHIKPASSQKEDERAKAQAQQNEQSKQRRLSRLHKAQEQKREQAQQAQQKQQQINQQKQEISTQRKNRAHANAKTKDYSRSRVR
ncbi:hypothetical protein [Pseudoalteromonas sp. MMG012]|uniref:hypothetical protein n=1 Tax=Pseudoalteromonas sp. MMG012 TaxID=2822686 RepID=UPI001B39FF78|nr:hypothetical protein [Pseudoalteromonas sp. MMG012]MBQ4852766.1 hypothetical protein [Pseudoalteromonas sp. MMG012]